MERMEEQRKALGEKVERARLEQGLSKEEAARKAGISSITWKRIEDGKGVQDVKRYAALRLLGLNELGESIRGDKRAEHIAEVMSAGLSEETLAYVLNRIKAEDADAGRGASTGG